MKNYRIGTPRKPLNRSHRGTGQDGIRLQKRQDADMAQKAAVVVRKMRSMRIGERSELRERDGTQHEHKESAEACTAAECHWLQSIINFRGIS